MITPYWSLPFDVVNGNVEYKSGKIVLFTDNRLIIQRKDVTPLRLFVSIAYQIHAE